MPFDVEFITFDEIRDGIPDGIKVIINAGDAYTAFQTAVFPVHIQNLVIFSLSIDPAHSFPGAENWKDEKVLTAIREFVDNGGGFIGVGEPSACQFEGRYFQLSDVLGVDREMELHIKRHPAQAFNNPYIRVDFPMPDRMMHLIGHPSS